MLGLNMFDYLIVGAGFSGCVIAERLASQINKKVLIVEKRNHVGGNCHDYYNEVGILVHHYGPHYFRTNIKKVFDYLSQFTEWHYVQYRIRAFVDGQLVPFPINLDTVNQLYGLNLSSDDLVKWFEERKEKIEKITNSEELIISQVGQDLYEKFFKDYTIKQWGLEPSKLDASVCGRIPIRTNRDNRYFSDHYQTMPKHGYTALFQKMLNHPNIHILLQTDYQEVVDLIPFNKMVFTGSIDAFFDYQFGPLPYRSLRFEHETLPQEFYQPVSQVNYPNDYDFTRVVEIKHVTRQKHPWTTIVREYPMSDGEPYYPVPTEENEEIYQKYKTLADRQKAVYFLGRLANYKYYNVDQVVLEGLRLFEEKLKDDG